MLYNVVFVSTVRQNESAMCIQISTCFEFLSHLGQQRTSEFPVLYSRFKLAIYFIHINSIEYINPHLPIRPTFLPPLVSIHLFLMSVTMSALQTGLSISHPPFHLLGLCFPHSSQLLYSSPHSFFGFLLYFSSKLVGIPRRIS